MINKEMYKLVTLKHKITYIWDSDLSLKCFKALGLFGGVAKILTFECVS